MTSYEKEYYGCEKSDVLDILDTYMKWNRVTQKELANEIGISPQYLNDILMGRRNIPEKVLRFIGLKRKEIYIGIDKE